ncbi:MAG TPA: SET domain-containing protein [Thermodesulfovibrionales bacterium]|nr:SET domain-containing protein [Thermodesulfovibrionales bacterium]
MEGRVDYPTLLIELRPSLIHKGGVGVFAVVRIKKGQRVAEGISLKDFRHQISWEACSRFDSETKRKIMDFCVGTPKGFIPPENMDFNKLSIEWYFNHSCEGNLGFDDAGNFIAIRNIKKGEELTYDYGLIESNPRFMMQCECKRDKCRKQVTGNDWELLRKNKLKSKYIHPSLRK